MNNLRRKSLYSIIKAVSQWLQNYKDGSLQHTDINIEQIIDLIQCILDEEEMYKDNVPENLQGSYRYEISESACENLDSAISLLEDIDVLEDEFDDVVETIEETLTYLNEATQ